MHDPTEGGLATALAELAAAAGCGIEVQAGKVQVFPETRLLCDALGADPWGLIASGALLIAASPGTEGGIIARLAGEGVTAAVIGQLADPGDGLSVLEKGSRRPLPVFERDEIARLLE